MNEREESPLYKCVFCGKLNTSHMVISLHINIDGKGITGEDIDYVCWPCATRIISEKYNELMSQ